MNKVIKNETEYEAALLRLEDLMDRNPDPGTPESEEMELLTVLIQDYESQKYHFATPDPVEAIKFRMEQGKLKPRDLIPFIGSRSKVSEILSKKRPLTLGMIRALHSGLGIPARSLIQQAEECETMDTDWDRFPLKEMIARGWVKAPPGADVRPCDILTSFFARARIGNLESVRCRSSHIRSARSMDDYALTAWSARVLIKASENPPKAKYQRESLTPDFMIRLIRLSSDSDGPLNAKYFLRDHGIPLMIERHLPGTYLDGAALKLVDLPPVIGLTLRYDRIDNFWFTLMHELAHLALDAGSETNIFYDDLDTEPEQDPHESEADQLAGEAIISEREWSRSAASRLCTAEAAERLASQLQIHPAIVAGRMRHEFKNYRLLTNLVGHRQVRKLFPEVNWG